MKSERAALPEGLDYCVACILLGCWILEDFFFNSLPSAGRVHLEQSWEYSLGKACANQILSPVDQHASEGYVICWSVGYVFQGVWENISVITKDKDRRGLYFLSDACYL